MQAPQAAPTATNNMYGSIVLGEGVKSIGQALLRASNVGEVFLVPKKIMHLKCSIKNWPPGVKLLATADAEQKLCQRGRSADITDENQLKIQELLEAASSLWEVIVKSEGHDPMELIGAVWIMFSTKDLQLLVSTMENNRAKDARRRVKSSAARSVVAPQGPEQPQKAQVSVNCNGIQAMLQADPIAFVLSYSHSFPELILKPAAYFNVCGRASWKNWADRLRVLREGQLAETAGEWISQTRAAMQQSGHKTPGSALASILQRRSSSMLGCVPSHELGLGLTERASTSTPLSQTSTQRKKPKSGSSQLPAGRHIPSVITLPAITQYTISWERLRFDHPFSAAPIKLNEHLSQGTILTSINKLLDRSESRTRYPAGHAELAFGHILLDRDQEDIMFPTCINSHAGVTMREQPPGFYPTHCYCKICDAYGPLFWHFDVGAVAVDHIGVVKDLKIKSDFGRHIMGTDEPNMLNLQRRSDPRYAELLKAASYSPVVMRVTYKSVTDEDNQASVAAFVSIQKLDKDNYVASARMMLRDIYQQAERGGFQAATPTAVLDPYAANAGQLALATGVQSPRTRSLVPPGPSSVPLIPVIALRTSLIHARPSSLEAEPHSFLQLQSGLSAVQRPQQEASRVAAGSSKDPAAESRVNCNMYAVCNTMDGDVVSRHQDIPPSHAMHAAEISAPQVSVLHSPQKTQLTDSSSAPHFGAASSRVVVSASMSQQQLLAASPLRAARCAAISEEAFLLPAPDMTAAFSSKSIPLSIFAQHRVLQQPPSMNAARYYEDAMLLSAPPNQYAAPSSQLTRSDCSAQPSFLPLPSTLNPSNNMTAAAPHTALKTGASSGSQTLHSSSFAQHSVLPQLPTIEPFRSVNATLSPAAPNLVGVTNCQPTPSNTSVHHGLHLQPLFPNPVVYSATAPITPLQAQLMLTQMQNLEAAGLLMSAAPVLMVQQYQQKEGLYTAARQKASENLSRGVLNSTDIMHSLACQAADLQRMNDEAVGVVRSQMQELSALAGTVSTPL